METKNLSKFSVLLALNKASMIFDPISWSWVTTKFRDWADAWECKLQISDLTSSLFQERKLPTHQGRVRSLQISPQNHAYSFFDPMLYLQGKFERCFSPNLPPHSAQLLNKINRFDRTLLVLGILPNQLRSLAKEHKMEHIEDSLIHLSDVLFWEGYEIWKKRKSLVKNFWENIAPKDWKVNKESKSRSKRKFRLNCKNPFHFCEKISDLSKQRRTVCACSDIRKKSQSIVSGSADIRYFLTKYPKRVSIASNSSLSFAQGTGVLCPPKIVHALVRDDLVRKEHDRGRKKKKQKT